MAGWGRQVILIDPTGQALPCHAAAVIPGMRFDNVRERELSWIWHHSEAFERFRGDAWMPATCRACSRKDQDFGGADARLFCSPETRRPWIPSAVTARTTTCSRRFAFQRTPSPFGGTEICAQNDLCDSPAAFTTPGACTCTRNTKRQTPNFSELLIHATRSQILVVDSRRVCLRKLWIMLYGRLGSTAGWRFRAHSALHQAGCNAPLAWQAWYRR
jgi:radical SAM protein with 4Fe4S-binding SPASM domain